VATSDEEKIYSRPIGDKIDEVVGQLEARKRGASAADREKLDVEIGKLTDIKKKCQQDCDAWAVWPRRPGGPGPKAKGR
jgi:hypothetical protein